MSNVHDIHDRIREGTKQRMNALTTGTVSYLKRTDELFRVRSEAAERKANIKRMITHEITKAYAVYAPDEAERIVAEAHEEVRKEKGVTA